MDPNANLAEQLRIAERYRTETQWRYDGERLAELVEALDEWIRRGGFLPGSWQRGRKGV